MSFVCLLLPTKNLVLFTFGDKFDARLGIFYYKKKGRRSKVKSLQSWP